MWFLHWQHRHISVQTKLCFLQRHLFVRQLVEQLHMVSSIIVEGAGKSTVAIGARAPSDNFHQNNLDKEDAVLMHFSKHM